MIERHPLANTTPFPNALIDEVMPTLTDTQWRLLCIVVRQTMGWRQGPGNKRKHRDWLTQSQLKARTGRHTAALSHALDTLVRQGLIEVQDEVGQVLLTASERRRTHSRLYFRLGARAARDMETTGKRVLLETGSDSAAPDLSQRLQIQEAHSQEAHSVQGKQQSAQSELRKANTTKETETKLLPSGKLHSQPATGPRTEKNDQSGLSPDREGVPRPRSKAAPNPDVQRFLRAYLTLFRQRSLYGEIPPMAWGRDGKIVKELLNLYPYERLEQLLHQFFGSGDIWFQKRGYSLATFRVAIGQLLINEQQGISTTSGSITLRSGHWSKAGAGCREQLLQSEGLE